MSDRLTVGRIVRTIGLQGAVKVIPTSDFRAERFKEGNSLTLSFPKTDRLQKITVKSHQMLNDVDILTFKDISTIEEAEGLIGGELEVEKDPTILKEGQYFHADLLKMTAVLKDGRTIGPVIKIEEYGPYITLRIKQENGKDVLIPFVKAFIHAVDQRKNQIIIDAPEGLL